MAGLPTSSSNQPDPIPQVANPADDSPGILSLHELDITKGHLHNGIRVVIQLHLSGSSTNDNKGPVISPISSLSSLGEVRSSPFSSISTMNLLAVTQGVHDIKFSIQIPLNNGIANTIATCEAYFDPSSDDLTLFNDSRAVLKLALMPTPDSMGNIGKDLLPSTPQIISPGVWRLSFEGTPILDFRAFERSQHSSALPSLQGVDDKRSERSLKRPLPASQADVESSNRAAPLRFAEGIDNRAAIFSPSRATGHSLLDLAQHGLLEIAGVQGDQGYTLQKKQILFRNSQSEVFLGSHSSFDGLTVVKIMKTLGSGGKPAPRLMIHQARAWLHEYNIQSRLDHERVVRLYGGDARFLSLYQEHIPGEDLTKRTSWRDASNYFQGTEDDALRIWIDISRALQYLHGQEIIHNDIKPANILYSHDRGAVLCDFGISSQSSTTVAGTPYYIPPEYPDTTQRGKPGDIWALGITVLYLQRTIPLPESLRRTAKGQDVHFIIADLHSSNQTKRKIATDNMQVWLAYVNSAQGQPLIQNSISGLGRIYPFLLSEMLATKPRGRPSSEDLVKRLLIPESERTHERKIIAPTGKHVEKQWKEVGSQRSIDYGSTTEENDPTELVLKFLPKG